MGSAEPQTIGSGGGLKRPSRSGARENSNKEMLAWFGVG